MNITEIPTSALRAEIHRREAGHRFAEIIRACADSWTVHHHELLSRSKRCPANEARTAAMAIAYGGGNTTHAEVAIAFGRGDTSTVAYAIRRHQSKMAIDPDYAARVKDALGRIVRREGR